MTHEYQLTFTRPSNKETITVTCEVETSYDPNYGADYDGNRGVPRHFIDRVEITEDERPAEDDLDNWSEEDWEAYNNSPLCRSDESLKDYVADQFALQS